MLSRSYRTDDAEALKRIFLEIGWAHSGRQVDRLLLELSAAGESRVVELNGAPEAMCSVLPGHLQHGKDPGLPVACVSAVATSRVGRWRGLGSRLTAEAIACAASDGAVASLLSCFEQGFYDRLGFGTLPPELRYRLDPLSLDLDSRARSPRRYSVQDAARLHANRLARRRGHGSVNVLPVSFMRSELCWSAKAFVLGYEDREGRITHHACLIPESMHRYSVAWLAWSEKEQFLELLALLRGLGDQVQLLELRQPPGLQLQDLIALPLRQEHRQVDGVQLGTTAIAHHQARLNDIPAALARTALPGAELTFELRVHDPIEAFLEPEAPWLGVAGDYRVTLGSQCHAELLRSESHTGLPVLTASVNAFTRLWLGVCPASDLALTDGLDADASLLAALDAAIRVPQPGFDFEF